MMKKLSVSLIVLATILTACNLPQPQADTLGLEDQAGTLAAQTLTAVALLPTETHMPANTPTAPQPTVTMAATVSPTPTTKPNLPTAPSLQKYDFFCTWNGSSNDLSITIRWEDKANDEQGYRVYRNGVKIADLAPNASAYIDTYAVESGISVTYAIEAYNQIGVSKQVSFSATCQ